MVRIRGRGWHKVPRYRRYGCWGVISSFGDEYSVEGKVLNKRMRFKVKKGNRVYFWYDEWVGLGPLHCSRVLSNESLFGQECSVSFGGIGEERPM